MNKLFENMNSVKLVLIVAAAIVLAAVALKVLLIVLGVILSLLIWLAVLAVAAFLVYYLVRSVWQKRTSP